MQLQLIGGKKGKKSILNIVLLSLSNPSFQKKISGTLDQTNSISNGSPEAITLISFTNSISFRIFNGYTASALAV